MALVLVLLAIALVLLGFLPVLFAGVAWISGVALGLWATVASRGRAWAIGALALGALLVVFAFVFAVH